jgi:hypothetical protein
LVSRIRPLGRSICSPHSVVPSCGSVWMWPNSSKCPRIIENGRAIQSMFICPVRLPHRKSISDDGELDHVLKQMLYLDNIHR